MLDTMKMKVLKFDKENGGGEGDEITFKSQDDLNDMVEKRLAKQKKKLLDEEEEKFDKMKSGFETTVSELKDEITEIRNKKESKETDDPKLDSLTKTVDSLTKDIKKMTKERDDAVKNAEKIETTNRQKTIMSSIVSMLSEKKVVAPQDIYLILKESKNIALDDDGTVIPVYTNTDEQVVGKDGELMELDEFIDGWLKERPHFVSASGLKGSDTTPAKRHAKIKTDGETDEGKEMTMTEILNSKEHKEIEKEVILDGSLQHGGDDLEQG